MKIIAFLVTYLMMSGAAFGQETRGTVFAAPGGLSAKGSTSRTYQVGGGIERLLERGLGASADVAAVLPGEGIENTAGLFAVDINYHFKGVRTEPFVLGGYSLLFRDFTANMLNFGGGVNYWFADEHGLRFEFRDNVGSLRGARTHYWGFRIGLSFR